MNLEDPKHLKSGAHQPVAWLCVAPWRLGWFITFGEDGEGVIPLSRQGGAWRPTRGMAEARSRRYIARELRREAREAQIIRYSEATRGRR